MRYVGRELTYEEACLLYSLGSKCTDGWVWKTGNQWSMMAWPNWPHSRYTDQRPGEFGKCYYFLLHKEEPVCDT